MTTFTCPTCEDESDLPEGVDPKAEVIRCDACKTRIAFGVPIPRALVAPVDDERFVIVSLDHLSCVLDKEYARELGKALQSVR